MTTQVPSSFHVAALCTSEPIEGVRQHARRNLERASLNAREIALLELLRAPEVYVEADWSAVVGKVRDALAGGEVVESRLRVTVAGERNGCRASELRQARLRPGCRVTERLRDNPDDL